MVAAQQFPTGNHELKMASQFQVATERLVVLVNVLCVAVCG